MKGVVQEVTKSKSGKAWRVKIADKWYGAQFGTNIETTVGKAVDFAFKTDPKFGDWLESWAYTSMDAALKANGEHGGEHTGLTEAEMRFVSNVVGQAILAKTITDPIQISQWAKAARAVLKELA